ncbi:MAG TPA: hypothetical protein VMG12_03690 [Polyangiaceae bacterium]|nr:hypothetical protein [Polyangiaceae bacterium]
MDCTHARMQLLSARRGLLAADDARGVRAHLAGCDACRRADAADAELDRTLERLPRAPAPEALRRRLAERHLAPSNASAPPEANSPPRRLSLAIASLAGALAMAAALLLFMRSDRSDEMFAEAVNDHRRVLYSQHPIEIESGGIHQVKPWFAGKLDFAPAVAYAGDAEFPLQGGSVAVFLDRKAAAFVFTRRLHTITLFVFVADGLPWPTTGSTPLGAQRAFARTTRGFHTLLWRDGDLGYAAVSDVSEPELLELARRIEAAR